MNERKMGVKDRGKKGPRKTKTLKEKDRTYKSRKFLIMTSTLLIVRPQPTIQTADAKSKLQYYSLSIENKRTYIKEHKNPFNYRKTAPVRERKIRVKKHGGVTEPRKTKHCWHLSRQG